MWWIRNGRALTPAVMPLLKYIFYLETAFDVYILVEYIRSEHHVYPDWLSRHFQPFSYLTKIRRKSRPGKSSSRRITLWPRDLSSFPLNKYPFSLLWEVMGKGWTRSHNHRLINRFRTSNT